MLAPAASGRRAAERDPENRTSSSIDPIACTIFGISLRGLRDAHQHRTVTVYLCCLLSLLSLLALW